MARVVWTFDALDDLEATADRISSPPYAKLLVERALELSEQLVTYPQLGRVVPEFRRDNIRELIYQRYRIVYEVGPQINVLAFVHGARDLTTIARQRDWLDH